MTSLVFLDDVRRKKLLMNYSSQEKKTVLLRDIDVRGETLLKQILVKKTLTQKAELIFNTWPNLKQSSILFCEMLSIEFPSANGSLIEQVICQAFEVYLNSAKACEPDLMSMVKYLNVLSNSAFEVQKFVVFSFDAKGKIVTWSNFSMPISKWARFNKFDTFYIGQSVQQPFESLLGGHILFSTKIMSQSDLGKLSFLKQEPQVIQQIR